MTGFDATLGYPGEGPVEAIKRRRLTGKQKPPRTRISLDECIPDPAIRLAARREDARRRMPAKKGFTLYYGNVSSWSAKAQEYAEHEIKDDGMIFIETHLKAKETLMWKHRIGKWGFRTSARAALLSSRSEVGSSGGSIIAMSKAIASQ